MVENTVRNYVNHLKEHCHLPKVTVACIYGPADELLPTPIAALIFVALLAALMTGATPFNLQGASNLIRDLYQVLFNPKASNKKLLDVSRITVVFIMLLGLVAAFSIKYINDAYYWALMVNGVMFVFSFPAIMFWPREKRCAFMYAWFTDCRHHLYVSRTVV